MMIFFTIMIQALQYRLKECQNHERNYVEKQTSFDHIPWEYIGQAMNYSDDPRITRIVIIACVYV